MRRLPVLEVNVNRSPAPWGLMQTLLSEVLIRQRAGVIKLRSHALLSHHVANLAFQKPFVG